MIDLAVFSDTASLQSDPLRGRHRYSSVEGMTTVTTGGPEIKADLFALNAKP
jgi:hypothetical protein